MMATHWPFYALSAFVRLGKFPVHIKLEVIANDTKDKASKALKALELDCVKTGLEKLF